MWKFFRTASTTLSSVEVIEVALESIGTVLVMASAGAFLAYTKAVSGEAMKPLARISATLTIPCLLFSNVLVCSQNQSTKPCISIAEELQTIWPALLLPFVNVFIGAGVAWLLMKCVRNPPQNFSAAALAVVAFGNSTGLPLVLLKCIHQGFPAGTEIGDVDPVPMLSVYLLVYPLLQWGLGSYFLDVETAAGPPVLDRVKEIARHASSAEVVSSRKTFECEQDSIVPVTGGRCNSVDYLYQHLRESEEPKFQLKLNRSQTMGPLNDHAIVEFLDQLQHLEVQLKNETYPLKRYRWCTKEQLKGIWNAITTPACIATVMAIVIAVTPARDWLNHTGSSEQVPRDGSAPLQWLFNAISNIGAAAVPINMMILGMKLSEGLKDFKSLPWATIILLAFGKMVVMPCVGIGTAFLLNWTNIIDESIDASFYVMCMLVTATPTANNVMVMIELSGQNKQVFAACVFAQYLLSPLFLGGSVIAIVTLAQNNL